MPEEPPGPLAGDPADPGRTAAFSLEKAGRTDLLAAIRADQASRWANGPGTPVEEYLRTHPGLSDDDALVLVVAEAGIRRGHGQPVALSEYQARFPHLAADIALQFELADLLRTRPSGRPEPTAGIASPTGTGGVVAGGGPNPPDTLGGLLRKRLLFLALVMSGVLAVGLVLVASATSPVGGWEWYALGVLALGPAAVGLLTGRRGLSVRQLRGVELALFGALYVQWSLVHTFLYPDFVLPRPPVWYGVILGLAVSVPWCGLILFYGILVPNTWRRCAAVVGVMAVTPLAIGAANGTATRLAAGHSPAAYLLVVGTCTGVATALAVFCSHRIEVLRAEVVEGRRLGPYRLGRRLGAGGMGEVYLAEHRLLKRPCAVKLIRPEHAADDTAVRRFEREVDAATRISHPAAVQVYDYGRGADGTFYYVMEYLPGLTLDRVVARDGPLPPERAVHVLGQVCGALAEAHALGLVHRDVKPGNIMLGRLGGRADAAKLLDFGLVTEAIPTDDRLTRVGGILGTPAYMSPEQARGGHAGPAADVYALGAVGYYLLTGRPPFDGRNPLELLHAHQSAPVIPPSAANPDVPADLEAVVLRCLAKNPAERYPSAAELAAALDGCGGRGAALRGAGPR